MRDVPCVWRLRSTEELFDGEAEEGIPKVGQAAVTADADASDSTTQKSHMVGQLHTVYCTVLYCTVHTQ